MSNPQTTPGPYEWGCSCPASHDGEIAPEPAQVHPVDRDDAPICWMNEGDYTIEQCDANAELIAKALNFYMEHHREQA